MSAAQVHRLLIVEDDERLRILVQAAAERCGCFGAIDVVADGQAGFERVLAARAGSALWVPDIILSDLSMPRMDGIELIRALKSRADTAHIPIVMMTSSNRPNDRELATEAGCAAFFEKPVRFDEIDALLRSLPERCYGAAAHETPVRRSA